MQIVTGEQSLGMNMLELQLRGPLTLSSWAAWQLQTTKAEFSPDVLRAANSLRMVAT